MVYPFNSDHEMIREVLSGFLQNWYENGKGPERIYKSGKAFDREAWSGFSHDLGMVGVAISEDFGGSGLGDLGRVVVMEELGSSLCAIPFLTTGGQVVDIISKVATNQFKKEYLPKIARGEIQGVFSSGHVGKEKKCINSPNADTADFILISRLNDKLIEVVCLDANAPGLKINSKKTMDPTRSFCDVDWSQVSDTDFLLIGTVEFDFFEDIISQSQIALAAECIGGAQKCLDMTLEYASQRVQFGRSIASFQAIKHRCADMFVLIEAARSAVYAAAVAADSEKTEAVLIAKANAAEAYFKVAGDAIQLHGGIGFTWEYPLHLFFKRARANRAMFGVLSEDYKLLADSIFGDKL